jgi:hypothetical protein
LTGVVEGGLHLLGHLHALHVDVATMPALRRSSCAWMDCTRSAAMRVALLVQHRVDLAAILPTTSRTADSAACTTASSGRLFSNR